MNASKSSDHPANYHSYLLRCWQEGADSKGPWRIVLMDLQLNLRRGFVDFESLGEFIKSELALQLSAALPGLQAEAENQILTNPAEADQDSAG